MGSGVGGHQRAYEGKTNIWLTPPEIIRSLGRFDLDPCGFPGWETADRLICEPDDGLSIDQTWFGRVWLNPPYGPHTGRWLSRLADHGSGTALIFARTETEMFFREVWKKANAILFLEGRLHFYDANKVRSKCNSGAPSVLIGYGMHDANILGKCDIPGYFVSLR